MKVIIIILTHLLFQWGSGLLTGLQTTLFITSLHLIMDIGGSGIRWDGTAVVVFGVVAALPAPACLISFG